MEQLSFLPSRRGWTGGLGEDFVSELDSVASQLQEFVVPALLVVPARSKARAIRRIR